MCRIFGLLVLIAAFYCSDIKAMINIKPITSLSGRIVDKTTGEPLPGATIYMPDLKNGTISDNEGFYIIQNLQVTKELVQISYVGYKSIIITIDLSKVTNMDFELEPAVAEMNSVVVTGMSNASELKRTPTPITIVSKTSMLENSSTNIIDALSMQPGISQITTGANISKPVIRGLGYNRVVVVQDGVRQEGQQWGDEHGIEIDEFAVDKVEILKGPASLMYGSDAMAGVINMLSAPPLIVGEIKGGIESNYQTNNGLIGYSMNFAGNKKGFVWDLRYSNKLAHAYSNKYDGYVFNSGFREDAITSLIGLNRSWGYSHLVLSVYNMEPGIIEGIRDSITGKFLKPFAVQGAEAPVIATNNDFLSYSNFIPYQKIHHYKAVWNNSIIIGDGTLKTSLGFQQNRRQEFSNILYPKQYGLYFLMNTVNYDVHYLFPDIRGFQFSSGVNGMYQNSLNKGDEFLIPEYNLFDIGAFVTVKKSLNKFDLGGGIRYDLRSEHSKDLFLNPDGEKTNSQDPTSYHKFSGFDKTFDGISGSIGLTWQISEVLFTKANISRGFRSPSIAEAASNGVHDGTIRYEVGNSTLKAEHSLQFDYIIGINSEHIAAEIDLFQNSISNFIFLQKLNNAAGQDSLTNGYSTFRFISGNANIYGGEVSLDIHPHPFDFIHFENSFSLVESVQNNQPDSTRNLPFTPSPKLQTDLKVEIPGKWGCFSSSYIKIGLDNYFRQDKIYSAFSTETATPGYTLVNLGFGTDIKRNGKSLCSFYFNVNNLTNVAYQNHLSRLKYEDVNLVSGRRGVFNMGRNLSFKLVVPVNFK